MDGVFCMGERKNKLRRWEIALILGLICALGAGLWLNEEQRALEGRVIRLHVIANSDSAEDQARKLEVRDAVLAQAQEIFRDGQDREEALEAIRENLPQLARAGREALRQAGREETVTASLEQCWFPTKEYDGFSLPAGRYTALRVVIGEGQGQNWWCVVYPDLCLSAASETVEQAAAAGAFTREQAALITGEGEGYVLKFKAMELLGELENWLF